HRRERDEALPAVRLGHCSFHIAVAAQVTAHGLQTIPGNLQINPGFAQLPAGDEQSDGIQTSSQRAANEYVESQRQSQPGADTSQELDVSGPDATHDAEHNQRAETEQSAQQTIDEPGRPFSRALVNQTTDE